MMFVDRVIINVYGGAGGAIRCKESLLNHWKSPLFFSIREQSLT